MNVTNNPGLTGYSQKLRREMTKEEMKQMLEAIRDGTAARKLQEEVNALKAKNESLSKKLRNMKKEIKKINNQKFY